MFTIIILVYALKCMCIPSFILIGFCYIPLYVPIVMYALRLFIVVLQELHCLPKFNINGTYEEVDPTSTS